MKKDNFKIGLEGYFTDEQYLYDGTATPTFWKFGLMGQKTIWERYSIFVNFENFTDTRQSRYKPVVNQPSTTQLLTTFGHIPMDLIFNFGVN
ncbi:MAG: hypothetical protein IPF52_07890 [Saprospiraceae bacterium]|nr:hypothetical protein [Saprospiraceae bacterium]